MADAFLCDALLIGNADPSLADRYRYPVIISFPGEAPPAAHALRAYQISDQQHLNRCLYQEMGNHAHVIHAAAVPIHTNSPHPLASDYIAGCSEMIRMLGNCPIDALQGVTHAIRNAHLSGAPSVDCMTVGDMPVLALGAGPSLGDYLPSIRALHDRCLIVACDAIVPGLRRAGIKPDLVTPLERVPDIAAFFDQQSDAVFCGSPTVHPDVCQSFSSHLYLPTTDFVNAWMRPGPNYRINQGSSTGVLAAVVGRIISTGKVYLVGHDLCCRDDASHWDSANFAAQALTNEGTMQYANTVECYDGERRKAVPVWDRLRRELSVYLGHEHGHTVVVGSRGAVIPGIPRGVLPNPKKLPKKSLNWNAPRDDEAESGFMQRVDWLVDDVRTLQRAMADAKTDAELSVFAAVKDSPNANILATITKSVFSAHLVEYGLKGRQVFKACQESLMHLFDLAVPILEEACDVAHRTRCQ